LRRVGARRFKERLGLAPNGRAKGLRMGRRTR